MVDPNSVYGTEYRGQEDAHTLHTVGLVVRSVRSPHEVPTTYYKPKFNGEVLQTDRLGVSSSAKLVVYKSAPSSFRLCVRTPGALAYLLAIIGANHR